ncbi:MAG: ASCH domain-containing protein [Kiritimatiellae bacterium]|nr:ASCH domain-containing protein [Kiritimatiellia bacterium]
MIALNLTIRRKWFDLIRIGTKREEFRMCNNQQVVRLAKEAIRHGLPSNAVAVFRNGYRMDSPALAVRLIGMSIRSGDMAAHPEWGEPTGKGSHFVISLGKVLFVAPYHDVREAFKEGGEKW